VCYSDGCPDYCDEACAAREMWGDGSSSNVNNLYKESSCECTHHPYLTA
jgi:hypothetical protein